MAFGIEIRDVAREDLKSLPKNLQERVVRALEDRLTTAPARYGRRLRKSLRGYWKLRVGDLRVVFEITGSAVTIWAILNRRDVYPEVERRTRPKKL